MAETLAVYADTSAGDGEAKREFSGASSGGGAGEFAESLTVTLARCTAPGEVQEVRLTLPPGSTVEDAWRASVSRSVSEDPAAALQQGSVGIWGKVCPLVELLKDGDRIEIYRPLLVDPKEARRERFVRQGSRSAGLFARDRKS